MSHRLFKSSRHSRLTLAAAPDTRPMVRISFPHCTSGPCKQGRKICPSPQACHLVAAEDAPRPSLLDCLRAVAAAVFGKRA